MEESDVDEAYEKALLPGQLGCVPGCGAAALLFLRGRGIGGGALASVVVSLLKGLVGASGRGGLFTLAAFSSLKDPERVEE